MMDHYHPRSFQRPEILPRHYFGEDAEIGQQHSNWRDLWSKLFQPSLGGITDQELMHMLLCLVVPNNDRNAEVAATLIKRHGNFANAISIPLSDHDYVGNVPYAAAVAFRVVQLAAQRLVEREITGRPNLTNNKRLTRYLIRTRKHKSIEQLHALFLDASNRLLSDELLAERTSAPVLFDPIDVVRRALNWGAAKVVLVQNFPHADNGWDKSDMSATLHLVDLCRVLHLNFVNHFIVVRNNVYILKQRGMVSEGESVEPMPLDTCGNCRKKSSITL